MDEGAGWVPGLDLLSEYGDQTVAVLIEEFVFEPGGVDCFEEFGAEGADVVEIWYWLVNCMKWSSEKGRVRT